MSIIENYPKFLRTVLLVDAATCVATGLLMTFGAGLLARPHATAAGIAAVGRAQPVSDRGVHRLCRDPRRTSAHRCLAGHPRQCRLGRRELVGHLRRRNQSECVRIRFRGGPGSGRGGAGGAGVNRRAQTERGRVTGIAGKVIRTDGTRRSAGRRAFACRNRKYFAKIFLLPVGSLPATPS